MTTNNWSGDTILIAGACGSLLALLALRWWVRRVQKRAASYEGILTSGDADHDAPSVDQVLIDTATRLLDLQISGFDRLNDRIGSSVTVGSTVVPVTIGLLGLLEDAPMAAATEALMTAALLAYGMVIAAAIASFLVIPELEIHPSATDLRSIAAKDDFDGAQIRRWVAEEYARSVENNRRRLLWRGRAALVATLALYAEALALSWAALRIVV